MHITFTRFSLLFILLFCANTSGVAQKNGDLIEQSLQLKSPFTVIDYSSKYGIPQNQVWDIITKKDGTLIISTANGIVEFNGNEFRSFIKDDDYKKIGFKKLFWDDANDLLTGIAFDGEFYTIFPTLKLIKPKEHENIVGGTVAGDSIIEISRSGKLFLGSLSNLKMNELFNTSIINANYLAFQYPYLYIANDEGLYKANLRKRTTEKIVSDLFIKIKISPYDGSIYALSTRKLYRYSNNTISEVFDTKPKSDKDIACDMDFASKESLFIATLNGLYLVEPEYPEHYTKEDGLPSITLISLHYDKNENCLFVGTGEKGLLKMQLKSDYSFSAKEGFMQSSLNSIIKTHDGKVLMTENCCNIYELKSDTAILYTDIHKNFACLTEIDSVLYAGTWGSGIVLIKNKKVIKTILQPQLPNKNVHGIYKDSKGVIWIGTGDGIATGKNPSDIKPTLTNKIRKNIISFYELKNGTMCIGGADGFYIVKNGSLVKHINEKDGLKGKEVRAFYEDNEGKIWVGTYDGGIYCYYKDNLRSINSMKGCKLDRDAFCFAKDEYDYFYITSNHGLWRIEEKDLNDFYYGKIKYLIPFKYDEENGILNPEFNGGFQNNYLKTKMGHFYFPGLEGVVMVLPEELRFRKLKTTIHRIYINDSIINIGDKTFNRNTNSIQFDFSCVNYLNKYNVYFQHKLIGEKFYEWSTPQKSTTVYLKTLPPGKYTFIVRAVDGFNDNSPLETWYEFEILSYFYETNWFKTICLFAFLALTIIIGRMRVQRYRRITEEKERNDKQIAELELKALQSQMNPHFVFNCLNSIKYYILNNEKETADNLLMSFSSLMRKFLDYSNSFFVKLQIECSLLEEYLSVEKIRSNNNFDFMIDYPKKLSEFVIPSFIIQPFVENSIKHGINQLSKKRGSLNVFFKEQNDLLVCTIEDNGIGRSASENIASFKKNKIESSKGIALVKEKTELIRTKYNTTITFEIIDKYDTNTKQSIGTTVVIKIPLNENYSHNNR